MTLVLSDESVMVVGCRGKSATEVEQVVEIEGRNCQKRNKINHHTIGLGLCPSFFTPLDAFPEKSPQDSVG